MTLTRWKLLVVIGRKSECRKKRRDRKGYVRVERRVHKVGWWIVATKVDGHERAFSFLFNFSFCLFCPLDTRNGHTRDATPHCCLRSIDRFEVSEDTEESIEERARCSMINASRSSAWSLYYGACSVHASIFNIDHNVRVRAAERPGRIYPFHAGYLGNRHQIIRRGFVNGNENVYIMSRGSRRGRKVFNCYKDFIN